MSTASVRSIATDPTDFRRADGRDARRGLALVAAPAPFAAEPAWRYRLEACDDADDDSLWNEILLGRWCITRWSDDGLAESLGLRPRLAPATHALSFRERRVVHAISRGVANKVVALDAGASESTIATHFRRAMRKLGVPSRVALIKIAALARSVRIEVSQTQLPSGPFAQRATSSVRDETPSFRNSPAI